MAKDYENEMDGILFDYGRVSRVGLPEAVFCEKKPDAALRQLLERFKSGEPPILFTRLAPDKLAKMPEELRSAYDYDPVSRTAFAAKMKPVAKGSVAIIAAGTADASVAGEAARTLEYLGIKYDRYDDCGISALWRLTKNIAEINRHDVVIVVAGMEGALASAIGGLCSRPIFAVPTSVGYGVCQGGMTALNAMLASCAPGIGVLNIDNGYGAACAAARIIHQLQIP